LELTVKTEEYSGSELTLFPKDDAVATGDI
jgi:hypothetical protein